MVASWLQVAHAQGPLWGALEPGPHRVGFRMVEVHDKSQTNHQGQRGKPLQIRWWYPVETTDQPPVTLEHYARLLTADTTATRERVRLTLAYEISPIAYYALDLARVDAALDLPMAAVAHAPAATGRFPLVLWSVRHATPVGQSVLSEYLASHGYVVATVADPGLLPRYPYEVQPEAAEHRTRMIYVQDMEFTLGYFSDHPMVNTEQTALMTWSFGGLSAVLAQLRNPDIDAVISLDATNGWSYDRLRKFDDYENTRLNVPYLVMHIDRDDPRTLFDLVQYADAHRLTFHTLKHGTFNVHEDLLPVHQNLKPVAPWSLGTAEAVRGYAMISRASRHFLDYVFKDEPFSGNRLTNTYAVPDSFWTYAYKEGQPKPLSDAQLVTTLVAGDTPTLVPPDSALTSIASRLLDHARFDEAIRILDYAATQYPMSAEVPYWQATTHLRRGYPDHARPYLERVLVLDPSHESAHALEAFLKDN